MHNSVVTIECQFRDFSHLRSEGEEVSAPITSMRHHLIWHWLSEVNKHLSLALRQETFHSIQMTCTLRRCQISSLRTARHEHLPTPLLQNSNY